jgi:hypothetical protein
MMIQMQFFWKNKPISHILEDQTRNYKYEKSALEIILGRFSAFSSLYKSLG